MSLGTSITRPLSPLSPSPAMTAATQFYQGVYGPRDQLLQGQLANQRARMGMTVGNQQYQSGILNRGYDLDLAGIANQEATLGIDRDAIARQLAGIGQIGDLDERALDAESGYLGELLGLSGDELSLAQRIARFQADRARRGLTSDMAARGGYISPGYREGQQDVNTELAQQLERAQLGQDREVIGIRNRMMGIGLDRERGRLGREEDAAKLRDRERALDIQARDYGLSRDRLRVQLEQGLARLSLDAVMDVNQLMDMVNDTQIERRLLAEQIIREAMSTRDLFAMIMPPPQPPLVGAGPLLPGQTRVQPTTTPTRTTTSTTTTVRRGIPV